MAGTMAAYSDDIEQLPFDLAGVAQWDLQAAGCRAGTQRGPLVCHAWALAQRKTA